MKVRVRVILGVGLGVRNSWLLAGLAEGRLRNRGRSRK